MSDRALMDFLATDPVCVLSVLIDDRTVHSAAMHFSYADDPLRLYFSADRTQRKFSGFSDAPSRHSSIVVGTSEQVWITCQMSGQLGIVPSADLKAVKERHYQRIPSAKQFESDPNTVFLEFRAEWYRLTDFNSEPPKILAAT